MMRLVEATSITPTKKHAKHNKAEEVRNVCRPEASQGRDASRSHKLKELHDDSAPMPDRGATVPEVLAAKALIGGKRGSHLLGETRLRESLAVPTQATACGKLREDA